MNEVEKLPHGWSTTKLSEIASLIRGISYKKAESIDSIREGYFGVLRATNINNGTLDFNNLVFVPSSNINDHQFLIAGDVVIAASSGSKDIVGKAGQFFSSEKVSFGAFCSGLRPDKYLNQKYFGFYFQSHEYRHTVAELSSGSNINNLKTSDLSNLPFPIAPVNEQSRIVDKLEELYSELDAGVNELKAAQTKLSQYRQSLLKSAVEGSLTQQWRAENGAQVQETGEQLLARILKQRREHWQQQKLAEFAEKGKTPPKNWQDAYPEPVQPDTTDLPELPEGWVWATIDQCTMDARDITDGPFGSNLKTEHYTKSGPRVIRLQNIGDGVFLDDKAHVSEEHYATLSKHAIECGDVLVAMMGEFLPRACMVPSGVAPAIVKADCARIRVNSEVLSPKLLTYYLNSNPTRNRTKSAVKGIGRPRINLGYIRSIVVPLLSVIEQKAIADKIDTEFDSIDRQIEATALGLKQSEAQRKNILKSAFSGQLVPQDSNDEPASVLLEKIKREREALAKMPKPRKPSKSKKKGELMNTLLEVLTAENDWIDAQDAFRKCGIADGSSTDRIEEIYAELRKLEKAGKIQIQRQGDFDHLKLTTQDVKED